MSPDEMHQNHNPSQFEKDQIKTEWPQARGELLGFALHLERRDMLITAEQLRMAVYLADQQFEQTQKEQ